MRTLLNHIFGFETTRFCDTASFSQKSQVTLSGENVSAFGRPFQFCKLGAFLSTFPTGFSATGKGLDFGMLVAGFGELLADVRTDVTERIGILGPAFKELSRQGGDPRTIACYCDRRRDHVDITLREGRGYQSLAAAPGGITCFYAITKLWWPHTSPDYIR